MSDETSLVKIRERLLVMYSQMNESGDARSISDMSTLDLFDTVLGGVHNAAYLRGRRSVERENHEVTDPHEDKKDD